MAISESSRNALLPGFLYAAPAAAGTSPFPAAGGVGGRTVATPSTAASGPAVWAMAPSEQSQGIKMYSPAFYAACTAGGIASCGLTHMTVTPLDLVKCNMQVSVSRNLMGCDLPEGRSVSVVWRECVIYGLTAVHFVKHCINVSILNTYAVTYLMSNVPGLNYIKHAFVILLTSHLCSFSELVMF
jgi:hypothetical protein